MPKQELLNTNIAVKAGFTSMLVLVLIFGIFSLYQLRNITFSMTDAIATNSKKIVHVVLMRDSIRQRQIVMSEMMSMKNDFEREESRMIFFDLARVFREEREALLKLPINESENKLLNEILKHVQFAEKLNSQAVEIIFEEQKSEEGRVLISRAQGSQKKCISC